MNVYIWESIEFVSDNYHDGGGLVVVAESLDAARELLRVETESTGYGGAIFKTKPVPDNCEAFTADPDCVLSVVGDAKP